MLDGFKIEIDVIFTKCVVPVLSDCGPVPIVSYSNAKVDFSSFGVRKETVK